MSGIHSSILNYYDGMAEAYAETVARTGKPLSSFDITYDDEPENREIIKHFSDTITDRAKDYKIKCHVINGKSYFKDKYGKIFTKPNVEYIYFKNDRILKEYLDIHSKEELNKEDHKRLGEIFGYENKIIENFLK